MNVIRAIIRKDRLVFLLIAISALYFGFIAISRHQNFYSRRLDLGNMNQTVWNVAHGNGFTLTDPMGDKQQSRLAIHADFLLIAFAPLYRIWSDPRVLIIVQTIIMSLGALPVYWIARKKTGSPKVALLFSLAYLLYPPVERLFLHDFHAVSLSMTFLLFAYWYMEERKYIPFLVWAVLAGLGKEHIWITIGLMGIYIALRHKQRAVGAGIALLSFYIFYYLFWIAIPSVTVSKQHFALSYLSDFGDTQSAVIINLLKNPIAILKTACSPDRLYYFFQLFFPLGFLSLLSPLTLLFSLQSFVINTLSNNGLFRQIDYQYTSDLTPFIFISAIEGYMVIRSVLSAKHRRVWVYGACASTALAVILWGELPLGFSTRLYYFTSRQKEHATMAQIAERIPSQATVSATNNIGAHFSGREILYNFPIHADSADYAVILLGDQYAWPSGDAQKKAVEELSVNPAYTLIAKDGNFYAFKKNDL